VRSLAGEKTTKAYLEPQEVQRLEDAATNPRDRLLVRLLFRLGCRISEGLSLALDDIDFERGEVTIQHLKTRMHLSCPRCGGPISRASQYCQKCGERVNEAVARQLEHRRRRTLPVDREMLSMISEYLAKGGGVLRDSRKLLFGINRHRAWQIVRECAGRAGLTPLVNPDTGKVRGVSPHRLRDAFAVNAVKRDDSGDGLRLLQEHLGHQSFNTTARYRKVSGEEHRDWYARLWD